jgi:hypothetical protein
MIGISALEMLVACIQAYVFRAADVALHQRRRESSLSFQPHQQVQSSRKGVIIMDAEAAKLIGAGLAAIGAGMAAIGVGNVFGSFLESALRNPSRR